MAPAPRNSSSLIIVPEGGLAPVQVRDVRTGVCTPWEQAVFPCNALLPMPCGLVAAASLSRIVVFNAMTGKRWQELVIPYASRFDTSDVVGLGLADKHLLSVSRNREFIVWAKDKTCKVRT